MMICDGFIRTCTVLYVDPSTTLMAASIEFGLLHSTKSNRRNPSMAMICLSVVEYHPYTVRSVNPPPLPF